MGTRNLIAVAALAAMACTGCARAAGGGLPPLPAQETGEARGATAQQIRVGGVARDYLLLDARRGNGPAPLVIALHGGGGNAGTMVPRWDAKAHAEGIVVAFPEGLGRMARMGTWNAGGCCGYAMTSGADDVAFVAALIDTLVGAGQVDPKRIYVTGMSNGGMMTHRIAIALSNRLAGAAVVAGALFGGEAAPASPLPMLIMHGVKDQIVPFEGGESPMAMVARSQSQPFKPVRYAVDFWTRADGCTGDAVVSSPGEVMTEDHRQCRDGAEVLFYRLASATHMWPGATNTMRMLETTPYTALDATDVIWDFFKRHARR